MAQADCVHTTTIVARALAGLTAALLASACGPFERLEQNCMNEHVRAAPAQVRELPGGGFEVTGSGPRYTTLEVTQPPAGSTGERDAVADTYPKQSMRGLACRALDD